MFSDFVFVLSKLEKGMYSEKGTGIPDSVRRSVTDTCDCIEYRVFHRKCDPGSSKRGEAAPWKRCGDHPRVFLYDPPA